MNIAILMDPLLFVLGVPPENVTEKDQRYCVNYYRLREKAQL